MEGRKRTTSSPYCQDSRVGLKSSMQSGIKPVSSQTGFTDSGMQAGFQKSFKQLRSGDNNNAGTLSIT